MKVFFVISVCFALCSTVLGLPLNAHEASEKEDLRPFNGLLGGTFQNSDNEYIAIAINELNPACNPAYFGDGSWVGFNSLEGKFAPFSAWDMGKLQVRPTASTYSETAYQFIYDKASLQKSLDAKAKVTASYFGFSLTAEANFAKSVTSDSTFISTQVMMRKNTRAISLPSAGNELKTYLSDEALILAKTDMSKFQDLYGTHFISMQQFGCYVEMNCKYTFKSIADKQTVKAALEAAFGLGSFSSSAATSVEKMVEQAKEGYEFNAKMIGDVFDIAVEDEKKLDSWVHALLTNFNSKCLANGESNTVKVVQARSWASILHDFPNNAKISGSDISNLMKASLLQRVVSEGYKAMGAYFAQFGLGQSAKPQWIEYLGDICEQSEDGPYQVTGPKGVTMRDMLKWGNEVEGKSWKNSGKGLPSSTQIVVFLAEMAKEYSDYNNYIARALIITTACT